MTALPYSPNCRFLSMPQAASFPTRKTTFSPCRTAVSNSIALNPNAPSPTMQNARDSGLASFAAIAIGTDCPSMPRFGR